MSALEALAQAVLDGRVHLEVTDTYAFGERNGSFVTVLIDPVPEAAADAAERGAAS